MTDEKRYFLKNSSLMEEIHKSKLTYCCYTNKEYTNYDVICNSYELITPNIIHNFFEKNPERDYIIIRVMTDEHVLPYCKNKNEKVNLQDLKMPPFKHFYLSKKDFMKVFNSCGGDLETVDNKLEKIKKLKEQIKDGRKAIRFNKLNKQLQEPYKKFNEECEKEIYNLVDEIKNVSTSFTTKIRTKMKEVLRSHWKGDTIEDGHFSIDHGKLTNGLVKMMMMLVDQYARSGNWAGYTWLDDMISSAIVHLCDVVLKFDESKSSNPFAYLTTVASMKFTATLNSEKIQSQIKSELLQQLGYDPTFNAQVNEEYKYKQEEWNNEQSSFETE